MLKINKGMSIILASMIAVSMVGCSNSNSNSESKLKVKQEETNYDWNEMYENMKKDHENESFPRVSGKELTKNPNKYEGENVQIMGQVKEITFMDKKGYREYKLDIDGYIVYATLISAPNYVKGIMEYDYIIINGRGWGMEEHNGKDYACVDGYYLVNKGTSKEEVEVNIIENKTNTKEVTEEKEEDKTETKDTQTNTKTKDTQTNTKTKEVEEENEEIIGNCCWCGKDISDNEKHNYTEDNQLICSNCYPNYCDWLDSYTEEDMEVIETEEDVDTTDDSGEDIFG